MNEKTLTYNSRLKSLRTTLQDKNTEAFLITHIPHIRYITGFSGSTAMLLILKENKAVFFTDFRYLNQSRTELSGSETEIRIVKDNYLGSVSACLADRKIGSLAIQPKNMTCYQFSELKMKSPKIKLILADDICEKIIRIKSRWECEAITNAARIADELFLKLQTWYKEDISEKEIAARLEYEGRLLGAEGTSFPSIIASGKNAALPHAQTTDKHPVRGEMILADYGQKWQGYCSDMTRTVCLGKADTKTREIYSIVLEAQESALRRVKAGISCAEIDRTARKIIEDAGYGEQFGHGLGHGVGIEVHEGPKLSPTSRDILKAGMVITIEPGIYIPDWGGIRIEDIITVTETGYNNLAHSEKKLLEIN